MTGNNLLPDTNIIIEVFDGNKDIADKINKLLLLNTKIYRYPRSIQTLTD